jgi:hypothetical protein
MVVRGLPDAAITADRPAKLGRAPDEGSPSLQHVARVATNLAKLEPLDR